MSHVPLVPCPMSNVSPVPCPIPHVSHIPSAPCPMYHVPPFPIRCNTRACVHIVLFITAQCHPLHSLEAVAMPGRRLLRCVALRCVAQCWRTSRLCCVFSFVGGWPVCYCLYLFVSVCLWGGGVCLPTFPARLRSASLNLTVIMLSARSDVRSDVTRRLMWLGID